MKILIAVDGSIFSDSAVQQVASSMLPTGVDVLVLGVVEPRVFSTPPHMAPGYAPDQESYLAEQFHQAEESVNSAREVFRQRGFDVRTRVVQSETRAGILDVAAEWHADLIVLGSHGRRGLQRFLLGSVAESVARNARSSVLIVRPGRRHDEKIEEIN